MAEAERHEKRRIVIEDFIEVKMSLEEARAVFSVLNRVAGAPLDSPRKHVDSVRNAIARAYQGREYDEWDWAWAEPEWACLAGGAGIAAVTYEEGDKRRKERGLGG